MPDEEHLTRQDFILAARALRALAFESAHKAKDPGFTSMQSAFEHAAASEKALADKFDRIAKRMT